MSKYVVILKDKACDTIEDGLNRRHVAHLKQAAIDGSLFLCGPLIGHGGAMQIIEALEQLEVISKPEDGDYKRQLLEIDEKIKKYIEQ